MQALSTNLFERRPMNLDDKICYCFHVSRRKLVSWVRNHAPQVPSQLAQCGGAGTGCGWCIPFLKQIFRQGQEERARGCAACQEGADLVLDELTPEEYAALRAEYVRAGKGSIPPGAEPLPEANNSDAE
jgi:NAD(P)H-nitrite reductase large subunit